MTEHPGFRIRPVSGGAWSRCSQEHITICAMRWLSMGQAVIVEPFNWPVPVETDEALDKALDALAQGTAPPSLNEDGRT